MFQAQHRLDFFSANSKVFSELFNWLCQQTNDIKIFHENDRTIRAWETAYDRQDMRTIDSFMLNDHIDNTQHCTVKEAVQLLCQTSV